MEQKQGTNVRSRDKFREDTKTLLFFYSVSFFSEETNPTLQRNNVRGAEQTLEVSYGDLSYRAEMYGDVTHGEVSTLVS